MLILLKLSIIFQKTIFLVMKLRMLYVKFYVCVKLIQKRVLLSMPSK